MLQAIGKQIEGILRNAADEARRVIVGLRRELMLTVVILACAFLAACCLLGVLGAVVVGLSPEIGVAGALGTVSGASLIVVTAVAFLAWRSLGMHDQEEVEEVIISSSPEVDATQPAHAAASTHTESTMNNPQNGHAAHAAKSTGESFKDPGVIAATAAAVLLIGGPRVAVKAVAATADLIKVASAIASAVMLARRVEAGAREFRQ